MSEQTENTTFEVFMDHQKKAADEAVKAVEALIPEGFRSHTQAAMNESAEGFRVLFNGMLDDLKTGVDKAFDSMKGATEEAAPKTTGKNKVRVEVN